MSTNNKGDQRVKRSGSKLQKTEPEKEVVEPKRSGRPKKQTEDDSKTQQKNDEDVETVKSTTKTAKKATKEAKVEPEVKEVKVKAVKKGSKKEEVVEEEEEDTAVEENAKEENKEEKQDEATDSNESRFDKLMENLATTRKAIMELQKEEKIILKKIGNVHKSEVKRATMRKRKPNAKATGFATKKTIGGELAKWLHVEDGSELTGPQISSKFWERIKEEGLQDQKNKRVLRTNKAVSKIFGVDPSVNKSNNPDDENGFNMRTYQKYIASALANSNKK